MLRARDAILISVMLLLASCEVRREKPAADRPQAPPPSEPAAPAPVAPQPRVPVPGHLIDALDVEELRRQGLKDPLAQIVGSLVAHGEVIPHEGLHGSTMHFFPESVHILDQRWVYAYFEDGHVSGHGIFRYTVQPDSSLAFTVVYSELD